MYTNEEYASLSTKYGPYGSWAIWDYQNQSNPLVINQHFEQLHSKYVFLGLNISGPLEGPPWCNFRKGRHDRKLKYTCNDTILRGSYITDIFKGIEESKSSQLSKLLTKSEIDNSVNLFKQEMTDIGVNRDTKFIVLGTQTSMLAKSFDKYFRSNYKNEVIYYYHYSYYKMTDRNWVTGLWNKLGIDENFERTISKYKKSELS